MDEARTIKERQSRREMFDVDPQTGKALPGEGLSTIEKAKDVLFTPGVVDDPNAGIFTKAFSALGLGTRAVGASVGQGEITDPNTKLLRPLAESLDKWAQSREAQNMSADDMINQLNEGVRKAVLSGKIPKETIMEMTKVIDNIEEQKSSGLLTGAVSVVGNISADIASDPLSWVDILKGVISVPSEIISSTKSIGKTGMQLAEEAVGKTSDRLAKLGVRNPKMIDYIDAQPGKNVREKLSNIRNRQEGALTSGGKIQEESISSLFDERTLQTLEDNASSIERELEALKGTQKGVSERVIEKGIGRKESLQEASKTKELGIEIETGEKISEVKAIEERSKSAVADIGRQEVSKIPTEVEPKSVAEKFTRGGEFSGRGINKAFNEAEELAKAGKIDVATRKNLIGEMVAAIEGDVSRTVDYSEVANYLWKINKDAPLGDYKRLLLEQKIDPSFAESFRRIKQGNANDIIASKRQFNKILSREGFSLDDTVKKSADNFKAIADDVVVNTMGEEGYKKLLTLQEGGGDFKDARDKLLQVMKTSSGESEIIKKIDFNDAVENLDKFIDKSTQQYIKTGSLADVNPDGRFSQWKKHFGIDIEQEVINRAKKLRIGEGVDIAEDVITKSTKEAISGIEIDKKKAIKALTESTGEARKKIDSYVSQSKEQIQKGFSRRVAETKNELKKAQTEAGMKKNVAKEFKKAVEDFATEGGFSRESPTFKKFQSEYGEKLANMVEDQAIFSVFDVSSTGKIKSTDKVLSSLSGVYGITPGIRAAKTAESFTDIIIKKTFSYDKRLNSAINKIKSENRELAKTLNKMTKKQGKDMTEVIAFLKEKQPLLTADVLTSEFKFLKPLDLMDKSFLTGVATGTISGYTNRERMAAKRMLIRSKR